MKTVSWLLVRVVSHIIYSQTTEKSEGKVLCYCAGLSVVLPPTLQSTSSRKLAKTILFKYESTSCYSPQNMVIINSFSAYLSTSAREKIVDKKKGNLQGKVCARLQISCNLKYLLLIIFFSRTSQIVYGSTCGVRGEAIHGKCELIELPEDYGERRLNLIKQDESIFLDLPFQKATSCAVVGLSKSLLDCPKGNEIDRNEAVFRIGFGPLEKFQKYIGNKVNVTLCRTKVCGLGHGRTTDIYGFRKNREYRMSSILRRKTHVQSWARIVGKDFTQFERLPPKFSLWDSSRQPYDLLSEFKDVSDTLHPSTGFCLALDLLSSSICENVNMYGFGGKLKRYHHKLKPKGATKSADKYRNQNMKRVHSPSIEKYIILNLEKAGNHIHIHECSY